MLEKNNFLPVAEGEILQKCIDAYGKEAQIDIAIEEMSELIKALIKERRAFKRNDQDARNQATINIAEEMSDVIIMITQLGLIFKNHEKVQDFIKFKLKREEDRIKEIEVSK